MVVIGFVTVFGEDGVGGRDVSRWTAFFFSVLGFLYYRNKDVGGGVGVGGVGTLVRGRMIWI